MKTITGDLTYSEIMEGFLEEVIFDCELQGEQAIKGKIKSILGRGNCMCKGLRQERT